MNIHDRPGKAPRDQKTSPDPVDRGRILFSSAHRSSLTLQINADRFSGLLDRSMHEYAGQFMPLVESWVEEQARRR